MYTLPSLFNAKFLRPDHDYFIESMIKNKKYWHPQGAWVAQSVKCPTRDLRVMSSSPALGSMLPKKKKKKCWHSNQNCISCSSINIST